jgi:hypothetical protein
MAASGCRGGGGGGDDAGRRWSEEGGGVLLLPKKARTPPLRGLRLHGDLARAAAGPRGLLFSCRCKGVGS